MRLARRNWGHLPPFGYTKDGPRVTTFGFAPTDPATPPTPIPVRRCCHGVAIDETEASNEHRAECQDARKQWKASPVTAAPTLVNPETGTHMVTTPSGRGERYRDPRGLGPEPVYEQCQTCGARYPVGGSCGRERCRS